MMWNLIFVTFFVPCVLFVLFALVVRYSNFDSWWKSFYLQHADALRVQFNKIAIDDPFLGPPPEILGVLSILILDFSEKLLELRVDHIEL